MIHLCGAWHLSEIFYHSSKLLALSRKSLAQTDHDFQIYFLKLDQDQFINFNRIEDLNSLLVEYDP